MSEDKHYSAILLSFLHLSSGRYAALRKAAAFDLRLHRSRLLTLLLSPTLFSLSLAHVRSLPLPSKTSLLARLLLAPLHRFASAANPLLPTSLSLLLRPSRDLDAAVLLLAMCDTLEPEDDHDHDHEKDGCEGPLDEEEWRWRIACRLSASALTVAGLGREAAFGECVDAAVKCARLLAAAERDGEKGGMGSAAAVGAVVGLEVAGTGWCAVCREETAAACGMPCGHRFHWGCILPWLRRRNTCPCCRFELPTEDVFCEIGRMWRALTAAGRRPPYTPTL